MTSALIPLSDDVELRHEFQGRLTTLPVGEWLPRECASGGFASLICSTVTDATGTRGNGSDRHDNRKALPKTATAFANAANPS
jgi:hypothetical protein